MKAKIDIYSQAWCNIVFDNKNKSYGAYQLRDNSGKRHMRALMIASFCFVLAICSPLIIKKIMPPKSHEHGGEVIIKAPTVLPPDKPDINKPAPPPEEQTRSTIQSSPPVIVRDEDVPKDQVMHNQDELNNTQIAISNQNHEGNNENGVDPNELNTPTESQVDNGGGEVVTFVENMPDFPGGEAARQKYLQDNITYPSIARESGIEGTVYVQFIVERNGKITNIQLKHGIGGGCDEEALKVVKMMPNWNPGRQNGQTARVQFVLPIKFSLQ